MRRASRAPGPGTNSVSRNSFAKAGCALIRAAGIQAHLGVAGQVELAGPAAVIDERDQAHFRVVVRRHADGPTGLNVAVPAAELGPVGVEGDLVFIALPGTAADAHRPGRALGRLPDVDELAPAVAGRVLPPAGHIQIPPGAGSAPGRGDHHAVPAVGQQRDRGRGRVCRGHISGPEARVGLDAACQAGHW